ncbi:MAG: hypothetical protein IT373_35635 [Polyangiaceae bacterium]|nr:hypothetical protein [Polyangiaceae bacterium]
MSRVRELARSLPVRDPAAVARARREATERPLRYPVGSGQADDVALGAGLRPLLRQLLEAGPLERERRRYERAGYVVAVAPRVYGPTHDGWDHTPDALDPDAPGARRALFVGRERARVEAAVACDLAKTDAADRELGRLLGYPRCCVEAFVALPPGRQNTELHAAAWAATRGRPEPRLNGLDLAVFHYVSWFPCAFDCPLALAYANAVASRLARLHADFVAAIDAALAAHRLVLCDELQLSLRGRLEGGALALEEVWPTARDRHPEAALDAPAEEAVARALALVRAAQVLEVTPAGLALDGALLGGTAGALLVPFGVPV